jgi:hypothetical protein
MVTGKSGYSGESGPMTDKAQKDLNDKLRVAASNGRADEVRALLEEGADVDGDKGLPLIWAAYKGHLAVVNVLLDAGADAMLTYSDGGKTAAQYAREEHHPEIAQVLENPRPLETVDEVVLQHPFRDRLHVLEEIFNFVTLERVSLLRRGKYGKIEAMTCTGFSMIEDKSDESMLRKAFNEHVKRGGKADESVIFPNKLLKNKFPRSE